MKNTFCNNSLKKSQFLAEKIKIKSFFFNFFMKSVTLIEFCQKMYFLTKLKIEKANELHYLLVMIILIRHHT